MLNERIIKAIIEILELERMMDTLHIELAEAKTPLAQRAARTMVAGNAAMHEDWQKKLASRVAMAAIMGEIEGIPEEYVYPMYRKEKE